VLKIGGHRWNGSIGIHGRHLDLNSPIRYVSTDGKRQVIPQVTLTDSNGKTIVFNSTDVKITAEELAHGEHRVMDCMDCHNRPTHAFQMPEGAVDQAMNEGRISPDLPFIKKKAVEALKANYPDRSTGAAAIASAINTFYRTNYPDVYAQHRAQVETATQQVQAIYLRNIFPDMKVTWGTYPNNIGHADFLGCFRCHDGSHTSVDGQTIPNDCTTCHNILAMEESDPKILGELGLK
jgi:formate-dependent nitrite reductase cytochrome c552 subunit